MDPQLSFQRIVALCRERGAMGFDYEKSALGNIDWYRLRYSFENVLPMHSLSDTETAVASEPIYDEMIPVSPLEKEPVAEMARVSLPFENIPQAMRAVRRWSVWRKEDDARKIPYRVLQGGFWSQSERCKSDTPAMWVSFDEALHCFLKSNGHLGGLSFALGDGWCGFDFDNVSADGKLHPQAVSWLARLGGYQEVSQSGVGVKNILRGRLSQAFLGTAETGRQFKNIPSDGMATEVYHCRRFFFLTGNGNPGEPKENQAMIDSICDELLSMKAEMQPKKETQRRSLPRGTHPSAALSDDAVLEKIRHSRQAVKFESLWNGQIGAYPSWSEADMGLTSILMWWCNNDETQVERLFEQSGLAKRDKWDREDYQSRTLSKAKRADGYTPRLPRGYFAALARAREELKNAE